MASAEAAAQRAAERQSFLHRLCFALTEPVLRSVWRMKVTGAENIPAAGPLIVASNHVSWFDGPVLVVAAGKRYVRFLTKIEVFRIPVLGWCSRNVGLLPLDRKSDVGGIRSTAEFICAGGALGMFPEGTRSRTGLPGKAKPGIGFLARESGAAVVPARLINTGGFHKLRRVEVRFGSAMRYAGASDQAFADSVMERIISL